MTRGRDEGRPADAVARRPPGRRKPARLPGDEFAFRRPFDERLAIAEEILEAEGGDLVYANSLGASVFTLAAARQKRKSILHVHEKSSAMLDLLAHDVTKLEVIAAADAVVLAAREIGDDLFEVFHARPRNVAEFRDRGGRRGGARSALDDVAAAARRARPSASSGANGWSSACAGTLRPAKAPTFSSRLPPPRRNAISSGSATGGRTRRSTTRLSAISRRRAAEPLSSPAIVDNPYAYMRQMDLFFLSSREDPNPVVIAEAQVLGVPLLCFSRSTAIADRLGRSAIVCLRASQRDRRGSRISACEPERLRSASFRSVSESFVAEFDLTEKMQGVARTAIRAACARRQAAA